MVDELLIRQAGPEEERQPRGELEICQRDGARLGPRLGPIQEVRARKNRAQRVAHAAFETALGRARVIEGHEAVEIGVVDGAAEGFRGEVGDDLGSAWPLPGLIGGPASEDSLPGRGRVADAGHGKRPADLQRVRCLDAFLAAFERRRAPAFVALGEAAMDKSDGELMLACCCEEADLPEPAVDFLDGRVESLIDGLVIGLAADIGAIELLAVEQGDDRVLELDARRFARQRHVADRQFVFAVGREVMLDDEPAARAERHARQVMLLPAGAVSSSGRQGDDHVGGVAIGRGNRWRVEVADGFLCDLARRIDVLVDECRRHLQGLGVVVEVAGNVVLGQQIGGVDVEGEQIPNRVGVLAAVQSPQRDASGRRLDGGRVDLVREPGGQTVELGRIWASGAGRRHQAAAQLANRAFPDLGIGRDPVRGEMIEGLPPGKVDPVMTIEAIRFDDGPRLAPVFRADANERDRCDASGCGDAE